MTFADSHDGLLAEQVAYYRARAPEYDGGALDLPGADEVIAALDAFGPNGDVLELACGTGAWTRQLLRYADALHAVDASPEMIELAAHRVGSDPRVRFVVANLFAWRPERRYDVVFFGFWISHVPNGTIRRVLGPGRRVPSPGAGSSSPTTPTGRITSSSRAPTRRRSSAVSKTERLFAWSRSPTPPTTSSAVCAISVGGWRSTTPPVRSTGEPVPLCSTRSPRLGCRSRCLRSQRSSSRPQSAGGLAQGVVGLGYTPIGRQEAT